jgi:predicted TIM-barrel fold metal-dependent hydrolase
MELENFKPRPALVTKTTPVVLPRFPVIDAHNHLGVEFGGDWELRPLPELLERLDAVDVRTYVDLDGGWGEPILDLHLKKFKEPAPERFLIFGGVNWSAWEDRGDNFGEWAAHRLRQQAQRGAQGLKIWKGLGLSIVDHAGKRVSVDDPRLDQVWQTAGELKLPVVIHVADPVAFFDPLDEYNERWEELKAHPDWHFPSPAYPPFLSIVEALARVVERHPQTTFIGAHVGCYAENLGWVGALLDRCPNFYVDISARVGELGRQPYTARRFFLQYADRILFGSDFGPNPEDYRIVFRFLETDDEYFNYNTTEVPAQGRWTVCGLHLPEDVLEKVYWKNARRLLNLPEEKG